MDKFQLNAIVYVKFWQYFTKALGFRHYPKITGYALLIWLHNCTPYSQILSLLLNCQIIIFELSFKESQWVLIPSKTVSGDSRRSCRQGPTIPWLCRTQYRKAGPMLETIATKLPTCVSKCEKSFYSFKQCTTYYVWQYRRPSLFAVLTIRGRKNREKQGKQLFWD